MTSYSEEALDAARDELAAIEHDLNEDAYDAEESRYQRDVAAATDEHLRVIGATC